MLSVNDPSLTLLRVVWRRGFLFHRALLFGNPSSLTYPPQASFILFGHNLALQFQSFSQVIALTLFAKCLDWHYDPCLILFYNLCKYVSESKVISSHDSHSSNNLVMYMLGLLSQVSLQILQVKKQKREL